MRISDGLKPPERIPDYAHFSVKGSSEQNEDSALVNIYGVSMVVDGLTSLVPYRDVEGKTGGTLAARIVTETFRHLRGSLFKRAARANLNIQRAMVRAGISTEEKDNRWSAGFAAVKLDYRERRFEWAQVEDCMILVIQKDGIARPLIRGYDHDKETLAAIQEMKGRNKDTSFEALKPLLRGLRQQANVDYGVLNGERAALDKIRHGVESMENVSDILLFTDGLYLPKENPLADDNLQEIADIFLKAGSGGAGLNAVLKKVRDMEGSDPTCTRYPRYKPSDDTTAVAIHLRLARKGERGSRRARTPRLSTE